jgi:hypothetical protein
MREVIPRELQYYVSLSCALQAPALSRECSVALYDTHSRAQSYFEAPDLLILSRLFVSSPTGRPACNKYNVDAKVGEANLRQWHVDDVEVWMYCMQFSDCHLNSGL